MKMGKRYSQLRWMNIWVFVCCLLLFFLPRPAAAVEKGKCHVKCCDKACCHASCAASLDDVIPMLPAPAVPKGNTYRFIAFGDTRTEDRQDFFVCKKKKEYKEYFEFKERRDKVLESVNSELNKGGIPFALFSGDLIWQGGVKYYWDEVDKILDEKAREKIYPVIGNHETWSGDIGIATPLTYYFDAFPHIKGFHNYHFKIGNSLFINLCSGTYGEPYTDDNAIKWDREWNCRKWPFKQVSQALKLILNESLCGKSPVKNVFLMYHKPSYSFYGHPPLDNGNDPLQIMLVFKKVYSNLKNVFVFNGHNHTTEMYHPAAGVWVIVAGGGGAPQDPLKMNSYAKKEPERFWETLGKPLVPRKIRVNYFIVKVKNDDVEVLEKCLNEDTGYFDNGVTISDDKLEIH